VRIGKVDIDFFDYLTLKEVFVGDQHGDTLVYAPEIVCQFDTLSFKNEYFVIQKAELIDPYINMRKYESDTSWNYQFLDDYFSTDEPKTDTTKSEVEIRVRKIALTNARMNYNNDHKSRSERGIDFDHLCLATMNAEISGFHQYQDTNKFLIERMYLKDCSGFNLDTLSAYVSFSNTFLQFDSLLLRTPDTRLTTPSLQFSFTDFDDFDDFENKVMMKSKLENCIIDLDDIAYFAPELWGIERSVFIDANFRGTVNEFKLKKAEIRFSEKTYIKGNFEFIGITDFENVFINARIDELASNQAEIENIKLPPFDGNEFVEIPGRYGRFGEILAEGSFTGAPDDFVAFGVFQTAVGTVKTDIRFHIDPEDGYFHYKGDLKTNGFRAGYFYEIEDLGIVSLDLQLEATGLTFDDFIGSVKGKVNDLVYRGIIITILNSMAS
jgi:hypothetical protein